MAEEMRKNKPHLSSDQVRSLLEDEASNLYDYLLRMTGQVDRSLETADEVVKVIVKWFENQPEVTYKTVRKKFFQTARNFCADIWDADVADLRNLAYEDSLVKSAHDLFLIEKIEKATNMMSGVDREILLLRVKYGFDAPEISEITKYDDNILQSISKVLEEMEEKYATDQIEDIISEIPLHPKPEKQTHHTKALSDVMKNIRARRNTQVFYAKLITLIFAALLIILYLAQGFLK